ncbi:MAG: hypothetical protein ACRCSS_05050 [Shewanella sp.]
MPYYTKKAKQQLEPWTPDTDMTKVSVSAADLSAGSPKPGDMIAINASNSEDRWLVAKDFFEANYVYAGETP